MTVRSPRQKLKIRSAAALSLLIIAGFGASIIGLVRVQFVQGDAYRSEAAMNQLLDEEIPARRGTIYDANGKVLAKSASVWKIYINPLRFAEIKDEAKRADVREAVAVKLADLLKVNKDTVLELTKRENTEYALVKGKVEYKEKELIADLRGDNDKEKSSEESAEDSKPDSINYKLYVGIKSDEKRYYPKGSFASEVIGFCDDEGGEYGIEATCNSLLAGKPGRLQTVKDAYGEAIPFQLKTVYEAEQGKDIHLTIDEYLQTYLEKRLAAIETESAGAYGIVMDVNTGAVLAMAGTGGCNLNSPYDIADPEEYDRINKIVDPTKKDLDLKNEWFAQWRNFTVSDTYEPGSVFKIITSSAAVEEKEWSLAEQYTCTGAINVAKNADPIHCHKLEGHGPLTLEGGLKYSCNPFFINLGLRLGSERFFNYFEAFGFTEPTGIDLPAEVLPKAEVTYHSRAVLKGPVELASSAFGQSFQVSPIQIITATAAIANGGMLMRPYVVAKVTDEKGDLVSEMQPFVRRQVISKTTAETVKGMMEKVVSEGTGSLAKVVGYTIAGKSGTSEKLRSKGEVVASFSCFAPANDPKIAVLIVIDEPQGDKTAGGYIAAPVAADVVENTLQHMKIDPVYTAEELEQLKTQTPNLLNKELTEAKKILEKLTFKVEIIGNGTKVVGQVPAVKQSMSKNGIIILYTQENYVPLKTKMPDFSDKTISGVIAEALASRVNVRIVNKSTKTAGAIFEKQSVQAGTPVDYGSDVLVYFRSNPTGQIPD